VRDQLLVANSSNSNKKHAAVFLNMEVEDGSQIDITTSSTLRSVYYNHRLNSVPLPIYP
jgi:hypothetical protein